MSWDNEERCPTLKSNRVQLNQSAYEFPLGRSSMSMKERNRIKKLCRDCSRDKCVYDYEEY